jgi:hypothetical protein
MKSSPRNELAKGIVKSVQLIHTVAKDVGRAAWMPLPGQMPLLISCCFLIV